MKYQVQIIEQITEIRDVEIEADSRGEAHALAYATWVEEGNPSEPSSVNVNERLFVVSDEHGEEEFNDDDFREDDNEDE